MGKKLLRTLIGLVSIGLFAVFLIFGYILICEIFSIPIEEEVADFIGQYTNGNANDNSKTNQITDELSSGLNSNSLSSEYYNNIYVNKYFYDQLDEYSQIIYKAFESNKDAMKTGTARIDFGTTFSDLLNQTNGSELLGNYYQSAIEAYTYDNPDVFYLDANKMYLNIETTTKGKKVTYNVYVSNGNAANYLIDEFQSKEQVDEALSTLENIRATFIKNKTGNSYDDIKLVHDYLINTIEYDSSISEENIYNIYGALVNKKCVCEGYARSMKYLLDGMEIDCVIVIGNGTNSSGATENHAWNYVKLDDNWYAVDATWDDPVVYNGGTVSESTKHRYFLKGSSTFSSDHFPNGKFTNNGKLFQYPDLSYNDYE